MTASGDAIEIVDVTDLDAFRLIPPCADPGFDHRTCDYWEDERRGSKVARPAWLEPPRGVEPAQPESFNPFARASSGTSFNPFDPRAAGGGGRANPFDPFADESDEPIDNPFAPRREAPAGPGSDAPRKLQLLSRGLGVFGSYGKVLIAGAWAAAYCQFGPLSAYPRGQRVRDLYPRLPASPLPAVITCIATTRAARDQGLARRLVLAVVDDLAGRGFSAIETYPEPGADPDTTSAASPGFWLGCGFEIAVDDPRFPVMRREL